MFEKRTNQNQEPEGPPDNRTDEEKLLDAVCPWRTKTYDQQLSDKQQKRFHYVLLPNYDET